MRLAQRRHAEIDEAGLQPFAAEAAVRLMYRVSDRIRDFRIYR
jgi:hypothetical protein